MDASEGHADEHLNVCQIVVQKSRRRRLRRSGCDYANPFISSNAFNTVSVQRHLRMCMRWHYAQTLDSDLGIYGTGNLFSVNMHLVPPCT